MNTMQQEFDAVVLHLYTQGRPAEKTEGATGTMCLYRLVENGKTLSCAVGCRIPDAVYVPEMDQDTEGEGTGLIPLVRKYGHVLPPEITKYQEMFFNLQAVHDNVQRDENGAFIMARLESNLRVIASRHGLTFTVPEAFVQKEEK